MCPWSGHIMLHIFIDWVKVYYLVFCLFFIYNMKLNEEYPDTRLLSEFCSDCDFLSSSSPYDTHLDLLN